jgi:hypothetical protein
MIPGWMFCFVYVIRTHDDDPLTFVIQARLRTHKCSSYLLCVHLAMFDQLKRSSYGDVDKAAKLICDS